MLYHRFEGAVGLGAIHAIDEDPWYALGVELVDVVELLDERLTAKDAMVADHRFVPMTSFIWCLVVEGLGGRVVEQMDDDHHRLALVIAYIPLCLRRAHVMATTVWLWRSPLPFFYGVYDTK